MNTDIEKEIEDLLEFSNNDRVKSVFDLWEFGCYIEKDGERIEPLSEEWFNALDELENKKNK